MDAQLNDRLRKIEARLDKLEHEQFWGPSKAPTATAANATPAPVATTPHHGTTEAWLGKHGLSFVGILLLLLGVGFLLVYSIQYLGPWGRDLLGLGAALALFLMSRFVERSMKGFSQFLFAGSAALAYFTVYAMHFFEVSRVITSQPLDLFLLFGVGALTTWYALTRYQTETATTLAYALIYLTFFVGDLTLFSFWALLLATAGIAALAGIKKWPGALMAGVLLTYSTYLFWGTSLGGTAELFGSQSQLTFDALFLSLYFLLFSVPTVAMEERESRSPAILLVTNALGYATLFGLSLQDSYDHGLAYVLFGLAAYHYLGALVADTYQKPKLKDAAVIVGSLALLGGIPLYWSEVTVAWGWLLAGSAQLLLGLSLRLPTLRRVGVLGITLASAHFFFVDLVVGQFVGDTTLSQRVFLGGALALLTVGISQLYRSREGADATAGLRLYLNLLGGAALVALAGVELESTYITLAWGLLGVGALLAGIGLRDRELRNPAFIAIILMLLRVVFVDLAEAETLVRVVSFIVLGIVLLGASWMYHRFVNDEKPTA